MWAKNRKHNFVCATLVERESMLVLCANMPKERPKYFILYLNESLKNRRLTNATHFIVKDWRFQYLDYLSNNEGVKGMRVFL